MKQEITIPIAEYNKLTNPDYLDSGIKSVSLIIGILGLLTLFWKISVYANQIKTDVSYLKENLGKFTSKVENIHLFLIRKFEDYRHREDD